LGKIRATSRPDQPQAPGIAAASLANVRRALVDAANRAWDIIDGDSPSLFRYRSLYAGSSFSSRSDASISLAEMKLKLTLFVMSLRPLEDIEGRSGLILAPPHVLPVRAVLLLLPRLLDKNAWTIPPQTINLSSNAMNWVFLYASDDTPKGASPTIIPHLFSRLVMLVIRGRYYYYYYYYRFLLLMDVGFRFDSAQDGGLHLIAGATGSADGVGL